MNALNSIWQWILYVGILVFKLGILLVIVIVLWVVIYELIAFLQRRFRSAKFIRHPEKPGKMFFVGQVEFGPKNKLNPILFSQPGEAKPQPMLIATRRALWFLEADAWADYVVVVVDNDGRYLGIDEFSRARLVKADAQAIDRAGKSGKLSDDIQPPIECEKGISTLRAIESTPEENDDEALRSLQENGC
jgi:hypothetical protein